MAKAIWNGVTLVDTGDIAHVEGNAYFSLNAVPAKYLAESHERETYCHWKGIAKYLDVTVGVATAAGAAWYYPDPYLQAASIKDRVAFWKGIEVTGVPDGKGLVEGEPRLDGKTGWEALCWLIKFSEDDFISMEEIERVTGITTDSLEEVWRVYDVQRYAGRYKRRLTGSGGGPYRLDRTG